MSKNMDEPTKKAIWKIIVYAVSVLASLFAGNYAADALNIHTNPKYYNDVQIFTKTN